MAKVSKRLQAMRAQVVRGKAYPAEDAFQLLKELSKVKFIENVDDMLADAEFSETEIKHEARIFGNVAQVASFYEKSFKSKTEETHGRGVNLLNLIYDGSRWLIMSIIWDNEREGLSLLDIGL